MSERNKRGLFCILAVLFYAAAAYFVARLVYSSGTYPSGSDTLCHLYKGDVLYHAIQAGDWYPLYDAFWYNGVEMLRYWAPLPVYVLALCQALAGGSMFYGYLIFVGGVLFGGAVAWLYIGWHTQRCLLGAFLGLLWFFMPNNLYALFGEGNLPRSLCMVFLPLFWFWVDRCLHTRRWQEFLKTYLCFVLMALCHLGYAGMIALALAVYLLLWRLVCRQKNRVLPVLACLALAFLSIGLWMYPSLQGGITSTNSAEVMKGFFQSLWVSLNPLYRYWSGNICFYFGLVAFALALFGAVASHRKSLPGFWAGIFTLLCTSTAMYPVLAVLPGSQYLWMLRFISIALCMILYSFLLWDSLKPALVVLFCILLVVDTLPSLSLIYGDGNSVPVETRMQAEADTTLISEAKSITSQRIALLDGSTLGSTGAYLVSSGKNASPAAFGAGWQSASTASNISLLNQAVENGFYLYLFDRCLEMGNDTVLIQTRQLAKGEMDIPNVTSAARRSGYILSDSNSSYLLYHRDIGGNFGTINQYDAIGIGTAASGLSLAFPAIEETTSPNLNDYTFAQLSQYRLVYLDGFTYTDKAAAEDLVLQLSKAGVRIVIAADGIPEDSHGQGQSFLGVSCQTIRFSNGYPELQTVDGMLNCDLFPSGYSSWKTVFVNGLDTTLGTLEDHGAQLDFYGTVKSDNIVVVGLNLGYFYSLTQDAAVGQLLAGAADLSASQLPQREIVPLEIHCDSREITVVSRFDSVNTSLAWHDSFSSAQPIHEQNHLLLTDSGTTVITLHYPYFFQGLAISFVGCLLTVLFLWYMRQRLREDRHRPS